MVRHHVLIGLGFKKQNFRNRALKYMLDKTTKGRGAMTMRPAVMPMGSGFHTPSGKIPSNQMTIMPVSPYMALPKLSRQPLKFNY